MNIRTKLRYALTVPISIVSLLLSCSMGGSAEQGNAKITGALLGGSPAECFVDVQLVTQDYNPFESSSGVVYATKTDTAGNYQFRDVPFGSYYLYAFDSNHSYTLLDGPYIIDNNEWNPRNTTLQKASVVTIAKNSSSDTSLARFFIKGTSGVQTAKTDSISLLQLIGVPAGIHDVMKCDFSPANSKASLYTDKLEILPNDSITISQNNRPPRVLNSVALFPSIVYVDSVYQYVLNASDPDSDSVIYSMVSAPEVYSLDKEKGIFSWTPQQKDIGSLHIVFKISDKHGAYSVFKWDVLIENNGQAPIPQAPTGESIIPADSAADFSVAAVNSYSAAPNYRFSWGDGDTSAWSEMLSLSHKWSYPDTYQICVQVKCSGYALPSAWSQPLNVKVNKSHITPTPSFQSVTDTITERDTSFTDPKYGTTIRDTLYDTIFLNIIPISCSSVPLYRFYCNGNAITDWTPKTTIRIVPDSAGTYKFSAEAWCDTSVTLPSDLSELYTVTVNHMLQPPVITGDTYYDSTLGVIKLQLTSETQTAGTPVLYRLSFYLKYVGNGVKGAYLGKINLDTCVGDLICPTANELYNSEPTIWFSGNQIDVQFSKPSGIIEVQSQVKVAGKPESAWSSYSIAPH